MDEADQSLPFSSPSKGEDGDDEPRDGGTAGPVLRCSSTGYLGMRSCCEDGKLEGDSVLLGDGCCEGFEARSNEFNGSGGDQNLEVELSDNEDTEVNFGRVDNVLKCQGVEKESRHVELEKALVEVGFPMTDFDGCEAKKEAEMVCSLTNTGNSCAELVSGVQEAESECPGVLKAEGENGYLGLEHAADVSVSKKDFEGCEAEVRPVSVTADVSPEIHGIIENGPPSNSETSHVKLASVLQEPEEECEGVLGGKEENAHLGSENPVEVVISEELDFCQLQTASANDDIVDRSLEVEITGNEASVGSAGGLGDLTLGKKDDEVEYPVYLGAQEASKCLGLAKIEVETPELVRGDKHDQFPDLLLSRPSEDNCFQRPANQKVGVSRDINTGGASLQTLEVETMNNGVPVNNGSGSGNGRKEAEEEQPGVLGFEEEIGHLGLKEALVFEEPKSKKEEEHDEFPGLSPLRTSGRGDFGSMFGIGPEVGFLSAGAFDSERLRNGCEVAELLVSSSLAADCPLVKINRDASKTTDGHFCPQGASQDCEATCTVESCEKLDCFEAEKMNFGQCSGNEFCSDDGNGEGNEFSQNLPLLYVGSQKEHCGDNITGPYSICPQEISVGGEVNCSVQGSPDEDSPCPVAQGLPLGKPSHISSCIENFSLKLSSSPDFRGSEVDAFIGMSACCGNVNSSCHVVDNGGRIDSKSSPTIVLRRSNPKRNASLRSNLADVKYNQSSRTGNNRRNSMKMVDTNSTFLLSRIKISDKLKKKRSCPHRPARASVWGPIANLIKIYEQNVELANCDAKVQFQNKLSKKGRSTGCCRKQPKSQNVGDFQLSSAKHSATSNHPVFHVVVGLPTSDCQIDFGNCNKIEAKHESTEDKCAAVKPLKRDGQLGDKDMESSLTQDASTDLGECPGVSSQIVPEMLVETVSDRNSLDPGTSPDSDVYHPVIDVGLMTSEGNNLADQVIGSKDAGIMTSEGATSINQSSAMCHNALVLGAVSQDCFHSVVSTSSKASVTPLSVPAVDADQCAKAKKGKMNGQVREQPCLSEKFSIVEKLHGPDNLNETNQPSKSSKPRQKKRDASNRRNRACSRSIKKTTQKGSKCKGFALDSSVPAIAELVCLEESIAVQNSLDKWVLSGEDVNISQSEALLQSDKTKAHKLPSGTKPQRSNGRSHCRETLGRRRQNARKKMEKSLQKSDNSHSNVESSQTVGASMEASDHMSLSSGTVNPTSSMSIQQNCKTNAGSRAVPQDVSSLVVTPVGDVLAPTEPKSSLEQPLPPQVAWVLCDDCEKWRCISVELANTLEETKCKWTCKDNTNKAFADCSIPQEKTNAEINAELGISDEEDLSSVKPSANGIETPKLADVAASQRASWIPIKSNVFLHRNRKNQTIDEIMVCHCKPPREGHWGCGDQCLNRMLNIECVKGTCPCGDLCSNQRFQKRKYAKFKWFRCGKKGYGLQLQEDVSQGQFLIEYVGEVLDLATYEARQRYYASRGQKHFYFMTLNGGEVIDACAKGNLGRFINHSCEPNCRTEKWMINGEVCIGLFAMREIKKGEEVTFDYNYVRVVGAAAKKCICGSSECRGYIGGDPLNSEIIVQGDSDEEDIEPVMIRESVQREQILNDSVSNTNDAKVAKHKEISVERKDIIVTSPPSIPEPEVCVQNEDDACRHMPEVNPLDISLQSLDSVQPEKIISRPKSGIQPLGDSQILNSVQVKQHVCELISDKPEEISIEASTIMNEVSSDSVLNGMKSITKAFEERANTAKSHSLTQSSCSRGTIKRGRSSMKNLVSHKTKTLTSVNGSTHFEGVEEKLNELLDVDGGISKQKDATRGYLKLLFVTAVEGDVGGCASQSTRDLSLILDAILKTKSRKVLVDIINKNGLQMLHNIMKQNRGNFNRIPIIRKLLKVFEFLALTGILTPGLINKAPPCTGMESFKESILKLANHSDKQVHKIAREFRDKWIPRNIRRVEPSDRDGGQLDRQIPFRQSKLKFQQVQAARDTDAIVISGVDHLPASSSELATPGETSSHSQQVSISVPVTDNISASGIKTRKRKSRWDHPSGITGADPQSLWSTDVQIQEAGSKFIKCTVAPSEQTALVEVSNQTYVVEKEGTSSCSEVVGSQDLKQLDGERPPGFLDSERPPGFLDDEGPPGFLNYEGPPGFRHLQKNHISQFSSEIDLVTSEVFMGQPQEIYLSHMTMSYGIPVALMQQLGTPETGGNQLNQIWTIAPGIPFYPFPPLPSYPRGQPNPKAERQQIHPASGTDLTLPSTSGGRVADMVETGSRDSQFNGRLRWPNNECGRRGLHPQRCNNRRFQRSWPRWPHQKFGHGFRGNARNEPSNLEVGNGRRDLRGGLCPPGGVNNKDGLCFNFHELHD